LLREAAKAAMEEAHETTELAAAEYATEETSRSFVSRDARTPKTPRRSGSHQRSPLAAVLALLVLVALLVLFAHRAGGTSSAQQPPRSTSQHRRQHATALLDKLGTTLEEVQAAQDLDWSVQKLAAEDAVGIVQLAGSGALANLVSLDFSSNQFGDKGMQALFSAVPSERMALHKLKVRSPATAQP
jgi:hypothetical protein